MLIRHLKETTQMAHIHPSEVDLSQLDSRSAVQEAMTLKYLAKALSNQFTIYHNVHWTLAHKDTTSFGEIDFIVVNRAGRILVVEQKNGAILETPNGLFKKYIYRDKSVVTQINRNIDGLRNRFNKTSNGNIGLDINYILYCPDHFIRTPDIADIDIDRIVDSRTKDSLAQKITNILGTNEDPAAAPIVHQFLRQELHLVPDIHGQQANQEELFIKASNGLVQIAQNLTMSPYRLKVEGTAGSGKSILAAQQFQESVTAKKNTLLLCFNRPLAERYKRRLPAGGIIATWNAFTVSFLESVGQKPDFSQSSQSNFWSELEDQFEQASSNPPNEWLFDTIIIDEGQDFKPTWWLMLEPFIKPDSRVLWLEDPQQNVRKAEEERDDIALTYYASQNFRSPYKIAHYIKSTLPFEFDIACPMPGLNDGVIEHAVTDEKQQVAIVSAAIRRYISQGILSEQIVILTCKGAGQSVFDKLDKIANRKIRKFTGAYTPDGEQVLTEGEILFETVGRFKGKQAPVILLTDLNLAPGSNLQHRQHIAFTGMTRATLALEVLMCGGS
jgi:hypothetical protein